MKLNAALLALSLAVPVGLTAAGQPPAVAQEAASTRLTPAQATAATELLLDALQSRDGAGLHGKLAESVKSSVSVEAVQRRLDSKATINGTKIVKVAPGYSDTTVDAVVMTAEGEKPLILILDEEGKLLAWK